MTDILIALAIVGSIGLLAGIILAVASHLFHVKEDEKKLKLRECLPGINCGACGYKGCDDYAEAMANGTAKPNLCIPGAADVSHGLAEILGVEAEQPKQLVAFVHCNGNCEATTKKAVYDGVQTCKAAAMVYGGPDACSYGCMGYGDCAAACPSNAICIKDGIAHVDASFCVGCGLCTTVCPKKIITLIPQETVAAVMCSSHDKGADAKKACQSACIGCKKCEKVCPTKAIQVNNNLATIDYDQCIKCRVCVEECPTHCLKTVVFPEVKIKITEDDLE